MNTPFKDIFKHDIPLIDVRAENEFATGAFPNAHNLPILNDPEREQVGICYRDKGPAEAEALGYRLVSEAVRKMRIDAWIRFIDQHPDARLYCFRGGKRSAIAGQWLAEAGYDIERIPGGYKALRRYLLQQFEELPSLIIISGQTGVGKTELLVKLDNSIDLEAHARHRGSAFGSQLAPQPAQIDFENEIAVDVIKADSGKPIYLEDESRLIGRLNLPLTLFEDMKRAPMVLLEDSLNNRVDRIYREYVIERWQQYRRASGDEDRAHELLSGYLNRALDAIQKRLGGARHKELKNVVNEALASQRKGDFEPHKQWIEQLLTNYYDPMYRYQLAGKQARIIFSGTHEEILDWHNNQLEAASDGVVRS